MAGWRFLPLVFLFVAGSAHAVLIDAVRAGGKALLGGETQYQSGECFFIADGDGPDDNGRIAGSPVTVRFQSQNKLLTGWDVSFCSRIILGNCFAQEGQQTTIPSAVAGTEVTDCEGIRGVLNSIPSASWATAFRGGIPTLYDGGGIGYLESLRYGPGMINDLRTGGLALRGGTEGTGLYEIRAVIESGVILLIALAVAVFSFLMVAEMIRRASAPDTLPLVGDALVDSRSGRISEVSDRGPAGSVVQHVRGGRINGDRLIDGREAAALEPGYPGGAVVRGRGVYGPSERGRTYREVRPMATASEAGNPEANWERYRRRPEPGVEDATVYADGEYQARDDSQSEQVVEYNGRWERR